MGFGTRSARVPAATAARWGYEAVGDFGVVCFEIKSPAVAGLLLGALGVSALAFVFAFDRARRWIFGVLGLVTATLIALTARATFAARGT